MRSDEHFFQNILENLENFLFFLFIPSLSSLEILFFFFQSLPFFFSACLIFCHHAHYSVPTLRRKFCSFNF